MKKRNGFVSNSSSSSFVILSKKEITKDDILKKIGVSKENMLYSVAESIAGLIISEIDEGEYHKYENIEEYEPPDKILQLIKEYPVFSYMNQVSWYNDGEGYEYTLFEDEKLIDEIFKPEEEYPSFYYTFDNN